MKKVFYILSLLFLTLFVFGGSVFAADQYYFKGDGTTALMPATTALSTGEVKAGDYTVSGNLSGGYTLAADATVNLYITDNVTGSSTYFTVPASSTLNFFCTTDSKDDVYDPDAAPILTIQNTYNYTIGNMGASFGTINFNSGNYTVKNVNSPTIGVPIGSPNSSGGEINVYQAAVVNAIAYNVPSTAVGTPGADQKCTVNVVGGLLDCTSDSAKWVSGVSAGTGSINISNQGKIISTVNPNNAETNGEWTIEDSGGIVVTGPANSNTPQWNVTIGGEVTAPIIEENGTVNQNLTPPTGNNWYSVTVNPNGNLTLGATNSSGTLVDASFRVGGTGSYVDNYGTVTINAIDQNGQYPWSWNNNSGSDLTIASGATLGLWAGNFVNLAADSDSGEPAGQVTIDGKLNFNSTGNFQNDGNATLDGTVTFTQPGNSFQNNGTLDIGPIGTVNGNLTNEAGGTVTSQNPCYY